jgi:hypothetical protein
MSAVSVSPPAKYDINLLLTEFRARRPSLNGPDDLRRMLESLVFRYFCEDPNAAVAARLFERLFKGRGYPPSMAELTPTDRLYAANILAMRPHVQARCFVTDHSHSITSIAGEADDIVDKVGDWSLLKIINFALLLAVRPQHRAVIVTSVRNEGIGLLEWIAHHRSLGFDEIIVYTNNNTDGSQELLEILARHQIIRLINNTVGPQASPQRKAYEHSLHLLPLLRQYRWAFYLDADEFFIPHCGPGFDLGDFFVQLGHRFGLEPPAAISFNWKWYGSENAFEKSDGLVLRRFGHSIHNTHVKSLVRLDSVLSMNSLHCPVLFKDCVTVDSQFLTVPPMSTTLEPSYQWGQVNHYWNKSFHEFVIKKMRGRGAVTSTGAQRDFSNFFEWGANGRRGDEDLPHEYILTRTQAAYERLRAIDGVNAALATISQSFARTIDDIDRQSNLREIYERRGRS